VLAVYRPCLHLHDVSHINIQVSQWTWVLQWTAVTQGTLLMVSRPSVMALYFTQQSLIFVMLAMSSEGAQLDGVHQMDTGQAPPPSVSEVIKLICYWG